MLADFQKTVELKFSQQFRMDMGERIYANTGANTYNTASHSGGGKVGTRWNRNNQEPARSDDAAGRRCYRVTAVCLILLCVLLLSAIAVLWVKYNRLTTEHNQRLVIIDTEAKEGWRYFNYRFYHISAEGKNWTESRDDCRRRGAELVIINSIEKQEFIVAQLSRGQAWIGLSESNSSNSMERVWKWVDDSELTTGFWNEMEPNDDNESCVEIWAYIDNKGWNDESCSSARGWICEKNAF